MKRREFLQLSAQAAALLPLLPWASEAWAAEASTQHLTILHTNDVHSRIEPFPADAGRLAGQGGAARRQALLRQLRSKYSNVLLVDAGDYFQGTPYFNLYKGQMEIALMSQMGYDAACIGNHDFDAGMDVLAQRIKEAKFPVVNCNYDFAGTALQGVTKEYVIANKGKLRIGIYGIGISLAGLAPTTIAEKVGYKNPIEHARRVEKILHDRKCDLIVCLSHLGNFNTRSAEPADPELAQKTDYTDLIIGGHTHTFMDKPAEYRNARGMRVLVNQVGWAGVKLGQLDYQFAASGKRGTGSTTHDVR